MAADIVVPQLGESLAEATIAKWLKKSGEAVAVDEPLVELETDKVSVEVNAPEAGVLSEILVSEGENVEVGAVIGRIGAGAGKTSAPAAKPAAKPAERAPEVLAPAGGAAPARPAPARPEKAKAADGGSAPLAPSVRKLVEEKNLDPGAIPASGKDGRLTKGDVLTYAEGDARPSVDKPAAAPAAAPARPADERGEERVRMTRLRRRIAERLKMAQNTAAMLTTFNEADMSAVMALRAQYREGFEKKHGVRLGFMSFFVKAVCVALKELPAVNAEIDGEEIVYKNYYDIGVAVGTEQGLVVPVVRDADRLSFADIEKKINELGRKARDGKLTIDEMTGGTFTVTNGGVYGSLNSTPILNPPQSGILGMHKIQERPIAIDGKVEVQPMMYLALSYDHRIVDGREAVTFLVRIKECLEDPRRLLFDL
ncbi:MAG: 2-oxoglutarate dehydrogenase complex dihydrolipoyllysine-residue succinyltransferase [Kiloniellales bacterium]